MAESVTFTEETIHAGGKTHGTIVLRKINKTAIDLCLTFNPPQRAGDECTLIPLVRLSRDGSGNLLSISRLPIPSDMPIGGIGYIQTEMVGEKKLVVDTSSPDSEGKADMYRSVVELIAMAGNMRISTVLSCENANSGLKTDGFSTVLSSEDDKYELKLDGYGIDGSYEETLGFDFKKFEAWKIENAVSELNLIAAHREEQKRLAEVRKATLEKLTPDERKALGFN